MELQFAGLDGELLDVPPAFDDSWMEDIDRDEDPHVDTSAETDLVDAPVCVERGYEMLLYPRVQRGRKKIPDAVLEAVERQNRTKTETIIPPFGERPFLSFADFTAAWEEYEADNWLKYRIRDSATVGVHNAALAKRVTSDPVPVAMEFGSRTYRCTHGMYQKSRSTGKRKTRVTRYTACDARIVVEARQTAPNVWAAQVVSEVVRHNHKCSKLVHSSYSKASVVIRNKDLFKDLHLMIQANATTARIRDVIAMRTGVRLTAQELANFKRDRLGGRSALANLRLLLQRFSSYEGSRCLIIEDEAGLVCGIVLQSRAQRMMFETYGDDLILDWTHNTNNGGYYLGALMATGVSGGGVSVLDFLCLAQTKDMMCTVFKYFISWNPGAQDKIRSFVIDKDYAEWSVLKEMFPRSRVLFCQFHVIKWLIQVVQDPKYGLSGPVQDSVIPVLQAMVYAPSQEVYTSQQWLLSHMLADEKPDFISYMEARWYQCRDMWSTYDRGTIFDATNPTSNRIESSWAK